MTHAARTATNPPAGQGAGGFVRAAWRAFWRRDSALWVFVEILHVYGGLWLTTILIVMLC